MKILKKLNNKVLVIGAETVALSPYLNIFPHPRFSDWVLLSGDILLDGYALSMDDVDMANCQPPILANSFAEFIEALATDFFFRVVGASGAQAPTQSTLQGWAGKFDKSYAIGTKQSPASGAIPTPNFVGSVIGSVVTIIHQDSVAPAFPSADVLDLTSSYSPNILNLIRLEYLGNNEVLGQIVQISASAPTSILVNAVHYLDGASINDEGAQGGAFIQSGTITINNGYNLNTDGVLYKELSTPLNIGTNSNEDWAIVMWANLAVTSTSRRAILQLAQNLFSAGNELTIQTDATDNIRYFRTNVTSVLAGARNGSMKKYYLRSNGGNISLAINPEVGGAAEFSVNLVKPTGDMLLSYISLGAVSPSLLTPLGNTIIGKLAVWRGVNTPTFDQVANLTL